MENRFRLPVVEDVEPRLASVDKDGVATNVFYDKNKKGDFFATKRAGITTYISGSGLASGIFGWNDQVFNFNDPISSWPCIVWNGSIFCAIHRKYTNIGYVDVSIVSTDGINWTMGNLPAEGLWAHLAWNGTVFCAVGYNPDTSTYLIATSTDGKTWTQRTSPSSSQWIGVAANTTTGRLVIVSVSGTSAYSTDNGASWSVGGTFGGGFGAPFGQPIAWNAGAGLFAVIGGGNSAVVYTSIDGTAWTSRTTDSIGKRCIISNSTTFVVFPYNSGTTGYTSTNGITWNSMTVSSGTIWRGSWTGSLFLGVGNAGTVIYSSNGTSWTSLSNIYITDPSYTYFDYPYSIAGNASTIVSLVYGEVAFQHYATFPVDMSSYTQNDLNLNYPFPSVS